MQIRSNSITRRMKHSIAMTLLVLLLVSPVMAGLQISSTNGIVMTGADGIVMTGADGIVMTGADSFMNANANGIVMTGADGIVMTGADGIVMTGADSFAYPNSVRTASANGIVMTGADGIVMTGADGIVMTGADGIVMTGADGIVMTGADGLLPGALRPATSGLQSVDPELALQLNQLTDDSGVNAVVVYHRLPSASDLADLQRIGIVGGTRFHVLPAVTLTATREQIIAISKLPAVRSIYGNRTLSLTSEPEVREVTGVNRVWRDTEITSNNHGLPVTGNNVTVAVLDTGIDGTHGDLTGRVKKNVKLADTQSASLGFNYPIHSENLQNTDNLYGHGTFVAGVVSGNGSLSGGKFSGIAPGAKLVGLSAGDLS